MVRMGRFGCLACCPDAKCRCCTGRGPPRMVVVAWDAANGRASPASRPVMVRPCKPRRPRRVWRLDSLGEGDGKPRGNGGAYGKLFLAIHAQGPAATGSGTCVPGRFGGAGCEVCTAPRCSDSRNPDRPPVGVVEMVQPSRPWPSPVALGGIRKRKEGAFPDVGVVVFRGFFGAFLSLAVCGDGPLYGAHRTAALAPFLDWRPPAPDGCPPRKGRVDRHAASVHWSGRALERGPFSGPERNAGLDFAVLLARRCGGLAPIPEGRFLSASGIGDERRAEHIRAGLPVHPHRGRACRIGPACKSEPSAPAGEIRERSSP